LITLLLALAEALGNIQVFSGAILPHRDYNIATSMKKSENIKSDYS